MASAAAPQDAASPAAAAASAAADESLPELPLFSCKEAYVYRVPPATNHQAETWDVNNWVRQCTQQHLLACSQSARCSRLMHSAPPHSRFTLPVRSSPPSA